MPEHPGLPVEGVLSQLRLVAQAWVALAEGVVPGERSPVRVKRVDAPLPVSESVMDGRRAIESFVWTYSALLVRDGVWAPFAMPAGTLARLEVIAVHSTALTHHRNALVAWGFVEELAVLAKAVRWAVPTPTKRTSLGVPCAVDGCDGVYEVEVPLTGDGTAVQRKARFGKQAKAVCSVDDAHVMGATEVTP